MAGAVAQSLKGPSHERRYCFRLAGIADDAAIRQLLRETPMNGPVRVTLRREPSYFEAAAVEGPKRQTLIAVDSHSQRVVGMGARSIRQRYVDGQALPVGYLSGLRILPQHRRGTLLARGYREIRRLHEDGAAEYYLTTVADGNQQALNSLTGRRAGLPTYHLLGKYHTFVIPLRRSITVRRDRDLEIRPLRDHEMPLLVDFLQDAGKSRLFFPCYSEDDFRGPQPTFKELLPADILAAWRGARLVGTLALWDQSHFKQTVVEDYRLPIQWARPGYNALASLLAWPRIPARGQSLSALMAALPLVAAGDASVFGHLLAVASHHARQKYPTFRSLMVGLFERDPLFEICYRASLFQYVTHVFVVCWEQHLLDPGRFNGRDLYLELGCL